MSELCCADFEQYEFPIFTSTAEDGKAGEGGCDASTSDSGDPSVPPTPGLEVKEDGDADILKPIARKESVRTFDVTQGMSNLSLALSLGIIIL